MGRKRGGRGQGREFDYLGAECSEAVSLEDADIGKDTG